MITIFRGRKLSLEGAAEVIHAEMAVAQRDQIHHVNTGKSCNPVAGFTKIALHTPEPGWGFPGNRSISASTGSPQPWPSLRHGPTCRKSALTATGFWRCT